PSMQPGASPAKTKLNDYRWIIEEDRTFQIDANQVNTGAPTPSLGTNFHTSYMPVVAAGCVGTLACESGQTVLDSTGNHSPAVCDVGNGVCRTTAAGTQLVGQQTPVDPSQVHLDPAKRYYISILPGDAGNSFTSAAGAPVPTTDANGNPTTRQFDIAKDCGVYDPKSSKWAPGTGVCGHSMGGAPISASLNAGQPVNVLVQETPFLPSKISVFVFEDDYPLNGENDAGGGVDVLAPFEPGLGGFEVRLWDDAGGPGDATGQLTHDMFNMPLSNSLAGTIDPSTGFDACPISPTSKDGLVGRIVTCPTYESGKDSSGNPILSPLAGQAVIANMMPGRYGVQADPGADRAARGEEWLQTNTLDGQKAHDSFIKVGGPAYFQEFGPAGFHVVIGFANPAIINGRLGAPGDGKGLECSNLATTDCKNKVTGTITMERQSRGPDQRLYSSGNNAALSFTQCYVSLGDPDGMDIAFTKCDANGNFELDNIPNGNWRVTVFDQWNDQIVDGLSTPVQLTGSGYNFGELPRQQWHTDVMTSTFLDLNQNGVRDADDPGLLLASTNNRYRDGSYSNLNNTDLNGHAAFNEIFPLFNWYVIESDTTRYKQTGVHVVYDAGGPADGTTTDGSSGSSTIAANLANTVEKNPVPPLLRVPGAVYCDNGDCTNYSIKNGPASSATQASTSTGRIDPPWATTEGWQGFIGSYEFLEFGKTPYIKGENGGIHGEVIYASTRPFDDPALLIHTTWTPDVPGVTINLYQEGVAADGTPTLTKVDSTVTTSWDDWAQGFRSDGIPNMNCPGQADAAHDLFFYTLKDTPQGLNPTKALPKDSQFKCYDGLHNFNQVQPAPYDGMYKFPSVTAINPSSGKPTFRLDPVTGLTVPNATATNGTPVNNGTNCSICVSNPSGDGTFMLPAGKYVVEVVVPPGYELVKEEDKNILIGDNYIAPVTQQFAGIGNVFILPDQAAVNAQYNANNAQNSTTNLGQAVLPIHEGDTGSVESKWPCVGEMRIVPDFISLFPNSKEVAPFAGARRPLCDRKEVMVEDQTGALAKFWLFSSTHVAAHFSGFILDDLSSEFDPFSPQFGEKFAVPNLPVSIKDFAGNEVLRTYTDQWGVYNGLNYSTWEVNPPNPTGYAPTMMVACMNDPGNGATPDPNFNPSYSQFCYEIPYMPGQTQYMDTPVVPTAAFAEGYNPPDCAYPDATPAIASVAGDGIGPWVSAAGKTLTITALGNAQVQNPAYSGPQATTAPFNQKFINRHYGFGGTQGTVTIGGINAPVTTGGWSDTTITVTVPNGVPSCSVDGSPLQRNTPTGTSKEKCGQLVITAANGKQSIDAVTVTVGGKGPTYVTAENATGNAVQHAIDIALPGDLIILGPGTYNEMLLMWKPVRLQGVGAASTTINANTHPSGKMDPWRRQVNCLFGLALNGSLLAMGNAYDPTGVYSNLCPGLKPTDPLSMQGKVDPLPLEGIIGWDTTLNGNLAQLLQEPSLMGAYEGAAITVLGKGETLSIDGSATSEGDFPANSRTLTSSNADCAKFPSNYLCNPSRIDGLTLTNSSQGGGGIYVHAWNHYLEIANNRIHGNAGTLSGGINLGQGESPDAILDARGVQQPFLFYKNVRIHNNSITANSSYGDELFSASPSAAGGVTFCTGADYYQFNYNWVCGNLSTGDGGGISHEGFSYNGNISHNWILFNQSNNITLSTNGGGISVLGASPDGMTATGVECGNTITDADCAPALSDGTGPGLVIDSNLIMGNTAESGSGGGIRLQTVNGTEVQRFPMDPGQWYQVDITNNIIANNVAGWDGGGISLQDALKVEIINNTIMSNDTTASAGVLFNTLGAPGASTPPPGCDPSTNPTCTGSEVTTSTIQPAGLVTMQNTANLTAALPKATGNSGVLCPAGHPSRTLNGACRTLSVPRIENDVFWQNRVFHIKVGGLGTGTLSQQNLVTLIPQLNQAATGACTSGASYWDIGVRGDTGPDNHNSGFTLAPTYSILTDTTAASGYGAPAANNKSSNPNVVSQYCNGSHVPPENGGFGFAVPPGIADATTPNPIFNLQPAATVDEGNNWINMTYGPLSLANATLLPESTTAPTAVIPGTGNGNYGLTATSPAINFIPRGTTNFEQAPSVDFFGTPRKTNRAVDAGAVEFVGPAVAVANVTPGSLAFGNVSTGSTSPAQALTLSNTGGASFTSLTLAFTGQFSRAAGGTCGATLTAGSTCTINVAFAPTSAGPVAGAVTITGSVAVSGSPVSLTGTGVAPVISASLLPPTWSPSGRRGRGLAGLQMFTLTNTGNVPLTGIATPVLGGTSPADYSILFSGCGPGFMGATMLAPGSSCVVFVGFVPQGSDPVNSVRNATLSVTDLAGTQSSALTGTATR
ncbi:MAG: choice-of-anchor D domain-containing protein, partial [Pseudomonadota bacterium]|nr:choice-of-anchor D domain-containing protein [Pseudomonadota bacterium]